MRRRLTQALLGLELFVAVGAVYGGVAFVLVPDGSLIQASPQWLAGSPFHDFLWPGVVLFLANAAGPALAFGAERARVSWAPLAHVGAGALLTGWMVGQLVWVGSRAPIQGLFFGVGLAQLFLALALWVTGPARPGRSAHA